MKKRSKRQRNQPNRLNPSHGHQSLLLSLQLQQSKNLNLDRRPPMFPTRQGQAHQRPLKGRRHRHHRSRQSLNRPRVLGRPLPIDPAQAPGPPSPLVPRMYLNDQNSTELPRAAPLFVRSRACRADQNPIAPIGMAMRECRCDRRISLTIDEITETAGIPITLVPADLVNMTVTGRLTTPILEPTVVSIDHLIATG